MNAPNDIDLVGYEDYFCWILDDAMPWSGGFAVVLKAYFDASERPRGTFCVAGFAFGADRAKKATSQWKSLWGDTHCHMTDLNAPKGDFKNWTKDQSSKFLIDSIPIIACNASFGVAVSCDINEFNSLSPKIADPKSKIILNGFRTPYAMCCHFAMKLLSEFSVGNNGIAYFFESGDQYQSESQSFIAFVGSHPEAAKELYKLRSHTVLNKADSRLFEMADIFAWEWAKHVERDANSMPIRPSLVAMLGDNISRSFGTNVLSSNRRGLHIQAQF